MLKKFYSQAGQDLWVIKDVFGWMRNGVFLDIGAAGGIELSNTYALERYFSWRGVCIEADPRVFEELRRHRTSLSINCCIAERTGMVQFAERNTFYGGIVRENDPAQARDEIIQLEAKTLREVLAEHSVPTTIHYLSIDVEGAEEEVMSTFPYETHKFLSATIERPGPKLRNDLRENGYLLVAEHPSLDAFYIHSDIADSYRIRAIERALFRSLGPLNKSVHGMKKLMQLGIRECLRRL